MRTIVYLKLYKGENCRQTPFKSGYRPLFDLGRTSLVSGQITLRPSTEFRPGEEKEVEVKFVNEDYFSEIYPGKKFKIYEMNTPLGEGWVVRVLDSHKVD